MRFSIQTLLLLAHSAGIGFSLPTNLQHKKLHAHKVKKIRKAHKAPHLSGSSLLRKEEKREDPLSDDEAEEADRKAEAAEQAFQDSFQAYHVIEGDFCEEFMSPPNEATQNTGGEIGSCASYDYNYKDHVFELTLFAPADSDLPGRGAFVMDPSCIPYFVIKDGGCEEFCVPQSGANEGAHRPGMQSGECRDNGYEKYMGEGRVAVWLKHKDARTPTTSGVDDNGEPLKSDADGNPDEQVAGHVYPVSSDEEANIR